MHINGAYLKRLGLHGSKLVWRVFMILIPVIGYSFWQAIKGMFLHLDNHDPDSSHPQPHEVEHPEWGIYWGNR